MSKRIVDGGSANSQSHLIRPEHIDTRKHFWDAFGNDETEVSASWIVRLCLELGGWKSFTESQMEEFYQKNSKFRGFTFNNLIHGGFIVKGSSGKYYITHEFICRCFQSSPVETLFAVQEKAA